MTQTRAPWTRARFPAVTAVVFAVTAATSVPGLAGLLMVALLAGTRLPQLAPMAVLWCGALLASRWGSGPLLAGIGGAVAVQAARPWAVTAGRLAAAAAVLAGVALATAADLHGAALLAGVAIATATRPPWPPPPDRA